MKTFSQFGLWHGNISEPALHMQIKMQWNLLYFLKTSYTALDVVKHF